MKAIVSVTPMVIGMLRVRTGGVRSLTATGTGSGMTGIRMSVLSSSHDTFHFPALTVGFSCFGDIFSSVLHLHPYSIFPISSAEVENSIYFFWSIPPISRSVNNRNFSVSFLLIARAIKARRDEFIEN